MKLRNAWNWELGIGILEDNVFGQIKTLPSAIIDRRREARMSMSLPVRYRQKGRKLPWLHTRSVDVSRNGVRIVTDECVTIGAQVELDVKLPDIEKTVRLEGVIVWANPSSNDMKTLECGIAFKNLRRLSNKEKIMYFMADKICSMAEKNSPHILCRPASSEKDLEKAYGLVYREYLARGYCEENPLGMHYNVFSILPDSRTFLLEKDDMLLGTISLAIDSPCGLPMESLFPEEIAKLRKSGRRLAEVTLLALNKDCFPKKTFTLTDFQKLTGSFRLFKTMFDYARLLAGVTDLVMTMHPKHKELYHYLKFETIGPVKSYKGACGKPALPMHMDIVEVLSHVSLTHGAGYYFLRESTPRGLLEKNLNWSPEMLQKYLFENKSLFNSLSAKQKIHVESCYRKL